MPAAKKTEKETTAPAAPPAPKFTVTRNVTLPLLKKVDNVPVYIKITAPMFVGKKVSGTGENTTMEPATLANIINLATGEEMQIICNKVMESTLNEEYPDKGYVDKSFLIEQRSVPGKRYKNYRVAEIEVTA